jgi:hypothetical protein
LEKNHRKGGDKARDRKIEKHFKPTKILTSSNKIQINIVKNLKKGFSNSEEQNTVFDPTVSSNDQNLLIVNKKKHLSFRKSNQNCESSNLLSVKRQEDEILEKFSKRSKTENGTQNFFPDTIGDIDVGKTMNQPSGPNSFNIFENKSSFSKTYSDIANTRSRGFGVFNCQRRLCRKLN